MPVGNSKTFVFSKEVDSYLNGLLELLLEFFLNDDTGIKSISLYEFMFFVSAIHIQTSFAINIQECIELINIYRTLAPTQKKAVVYELQLKTTDRFDVMLNNAEDIFSLLNETVYFRKIRGNLKPIKNYNRL
jgi:hypothetical protein